MGEVRRRQKSDCRVVNAKSRSPGTGDQTVIGTSNRTQTDTIQATKCASERARAEESG
jgi:hypothetical protein